MAPLNLNEVLSEAVILVQHELLSSRVVLRMEQASALPVILADKVQLQQVILNLVINGIEAMQSITNRARELVIRSEHDEPASAGHGRRIAALDSPPIMRVSCSIPSSPPSPAAWVWDFRSAVRSSNFTAGASGPRPMYPTVRASSSPCLCIQQQGRPRGDDPIGV